MNSRGEPSPDMPCLDWRPEEKGAKIQRLLFATLKRRKCMLKNRWIKRGITLLTFSLFFFSILETDAFARVGGGRSSGSRGSRSFSSPKPSSPSRVSVVSAFPDSQLSPGIGSAIPGPVHSSSPNTAPEQFLERSGRRYLGWFDRRNALQQPWLRT